MNAELSSPPSAYSPAFTLAPCPASGEALDLADLDFVVIGPPRGSACRPCLPDGEDEQLRFLGTAEAHGAITPEGAAPSRPISGDIQMPCFFAGMGEIVVSPKRVVGVMFEGNTLVGPAKPGRNLIAFSVPFSEVGSIRQGQRKGMFGKVKPGKVGLTGIEAWPFLLSFEVYFRLTLEGKQSGANGDDLMDPLVGLICAYQLADPQLHAERGDRLVAASNGQRSEDGSQLVALLAQ